METLKQLFFGKYFFVLCPFFIVFIIHIFSSPNYSYLSTKYSTCPACCNMQEKLDRKDHILESVSGKYGSYTHMAKTEFRLTIPFIAKVLNIKTKYEMYGLQVFASLLFFYFLNLLLFRFTNDKSIAFLFSLSFGFIYPGYSFIAEMTGFFDSFVFLLLLIAMLDVSIIYVFLALFFAFWTDERAIFASLLVVFYWQYQQHVKHGFKFYIPTLKSYVFLGTLVIYVFLRWYLITDFGFKNQTDGTGLAILKKTINYSGIAFWQMFEGFWLFVGLAIYQLFKSRSYLIVVTFFTLNLLIFILSLFVLDITRSMAYIFPSVIIAFFIIKDTMERKELKKITLIVLFFSFVFPSYIFIVGSDLYPYNPIFIRVAKHFLHI